MNACIRAWNAGDKASYLGSSVFDLPEHGVLITTIGADCVIALPQAAGGGDGSTGAWAWTNAGGRWEPYVTSESPDVRERLMDQMKWEAMLEDGPNAEVVDPQGTLQAIAPQSQQRLARSACPSPSPHAVSIEAVGAPCGVAVQVVAGFIQEPRSQRCQGNDHMTCLVPGGGSVEFGLR